MRAQLINEKFTKEGDPIKDMGIGLGDIKISVAFRFNYGEGKKQEEFEKKFKIKPSSSNYTYAKVSIYDIAEILAYLIKNCGFNKSQLHFYKNEIKY